MTFFLTLGSEFSYFKKTIGKKLSLANFKNIMVEKITVCSESMHEAGMTELDSIRPGSRSGKNSNIFEINNNLIT